MAELLMESVVPILLLCLPLEFFFFTGWCPSIRGASAKPFNTKSNGAIGSCRFCLKNSGVNFKIFRNWTQGVSAGIFQQSNGSLQIEARHHLAALRVGLQ
jgi:hypothetical protein